MRGDGRWDSHLLGRRARHGFGKGVVRVWAGRYGNGTAGTSRKREGSRCFRRGIAGRMIVLFPRLAAVLTGFPVGSAGSP